MSARYKLGSVDQELLSSAKILLEKLAAARGTSPAQLVTVAKLLHVISALPRVTTDVTASVSVSSPRRHFDEIRTWHWWGFGVEDTRLKISSGGHFYQPSTGGDTFSTMEWEAIPDQPTDLNDYRESLWMVPDVCSYSEGVGSIELEAEKYSIEILDDDNPLLEEDSSDEDDNDTTETDPPSVEAVEDESDDTRWSISPVDVIEEQLAAFVDPGEVASNEPGYMLGTVEFCDQCKCSLTSSGLLVDGRLRGDLMWSNMCASCFMQLGEGLGWGNGQLYSRQADGAWRMVAGWDFEGERKFKLQLLLLGVQSAAPLHLGENWGTEEILPAERTEVNETLGQTESEDHLSGRTSEGENKQQHRAPIDSGTRGTKPDDEVVQQNPVHVVDDGAVAYGDQQAMDDYRKLPPDDRKRVKETAGLLEQAKKIKPTMHLFDQVDQEEDHPTDKPIMDEYRRLDAQGRKSLRAAAAGLEALGITLKVSRLYDKVDQEENLDS